MIIRSTIVLQSVDSVPRDAAVNVLHWQTAATDFTATITDIYDEIVGFYAVPQVDDGGDLIDDSALALYLSPTVSRGTDDILIRFAQVLDPDNVTPYVQASFSLPAPLAGEPAPNECAACFTFWGTPALAVPIRRRRGRMYFGPLNYSAIGTRDVAGVDYPSLNSEFREYAARAMKRLSFASDRIDASWSVYSRADDTTYEINHGYIDNELDTVRSRGLDANVRTPFENPGAGPVVLP